jgi:hypothetical protein
LGRLSRRRLKSVPKLKLALASCAAHPAAFHARAESRVAWQRLPGDRAAFTNATCHRGAGIRRPKSTAGSRPGSRPCPFADATLLPAWRERQARVPRRPPRLPGRLSSTLQVGDDADGKCGVPLPPPASGHHRSIVVASIFSVKLSATGTPLCGRIRGNSLVPRRSWRAFPPAERQPTSASKCLENAENRTPFPWNAGLTSLGRENRVASRENFSDSRGHGPNPRHVHQLSRWPRAAVR